MMHRALLSFLFLLLYFPRLIPAECVAEQCSGCCSGGNCINTTDISRCHLDKNYNFDFLINTLLALASFIIGLLNWGLLG